MRGVAQETDYYKYNESIKKLKFELPGAGVVFVEFRLHEFPEDLYKSFAEINQAEINQVVHFGQSRYAEDELFSDFFCLTRLQFNYWHDL